MGIIRFNDEIFTTDSQEYEILAEAATAIKGVEGAIVEIGTRAGGSAKIIIDALVENEDVDRTMFCIDPYGNIDYPTTNFTLTTHGAPPQEDRQSKDVVQSIKLDYDNRMRNEIIPSLYYYAFRAGLNFAFFCMEDSEFFARYTDGVPVYNNFKKLEEKYALVFLDGPHTNEIVQTETEFFVPRTNIGSSLVYDDIWMYNHDDVEKYILDNGFEITRKGEVKASYKRVR